MALNTNIMNKTIKTFTLTIKILLIFKKHTCLKTSEMESDSKTKCNQGKQSYQSRGQMDKEMMYWCDFCFFKVGFNQLINKLSFMCN